MGSVTRSYMRKGFLVYEEMRKGGRDVYPGSEFFPSLILDLGSASKNISILTQKLVSELSEI